jgi:hypothetical protein
MLEPAPRHVGYITWSDGGDHPLPHGRPAVSQYLLIIIRLTIRALEVLLISGILEEPSRFPCRSEKKYA